MSSTLNSSIMMIPSTNYTHTMNVESQEPTPNVELKAITIELQVQQSYKLYVEPTRGCQVVPVEDDFLVSPKFTFKFKLPLYLSSCKFTSDLCINGELNKLAISHGLAQYLKPFIVNAAFEAAQTSLLDFKLVFDVNVVKVDLVNYQECDYYRKRGLV